MPIRIIEPDYQSDRFGQIRTWIEPDERGRVPEEDEEVEDEQQGMEEVKNEMD